jgi:hypothetical protein
MLELHTVFVKLNSASEPGSVSLHCKGGIKTHQRTKQQQSFLTLFNDAASTTGIAPSEAIPIWLTLLDILIGLTVLAIPTWQTQEAVVIWHTVSNFDLAKSVSYFDLANTVSYCDLVNTVDHLLSWLINLPF